MWRAWESDSISEKIESYTPTKWNEARGFSFLSWTVAYWIKEKGGSKCEKVRQASIQRQQANAPL